jgi:hypothetical protein
MPTLVGYWTDVVRHIFSSSRRATSDVKVYLSQVAAVEEEVVDGTGERERAATRVLRNMKTFYYINRFLSEKRGGEQTKKKSKKAAS